MANQAPTRKSIAREQMKDWRRVSFATRMKAYKTSPVVPIKAYFPTRLEQRKALLFLEQTSGR